ncbi:hypothetical protein MHYP_G00205510, partial [Metynnis hypsauchen]
QSASAAHCLQHAPLISLSLSLSLSLSQSLRACVISSPAPLARLPLLHASSRAGCECVSRSCDADRRVAAAVGARGGGFPQQRPDRWVVHQKH